MTVGKKYTLSTIVFYCLYLSLVPLLEHFSTSGPCTPGGGILLLLLTPLLSGLALAVSLVIRLKGHRAFLGPIIINGILFLGSMLLFNRGLLG
jgi:hypothetical protein